MIKKYLPYIIIAILIGLIFLQRSCKDPVLPVSSSDTVRVIDTQYLPQPVVHIPVYVPGKVIYLPGKVVPQPSKNYDSLLIQYTDIHGKFHATSVYKDKISLKDSSGKDVGVVNVEDSISENNIKARKVDYQLTFPIITNTTTITNTYVEPKKNKVMIGGGFQATNKDEIITGSHVGILFQNKKDNIYSAGVIAPFNNTTPTQIYIGAYWKISFKNRYRNN